MFLTEIFRVGLLDLFGNLDPFDFEYNEVVTPTFFTLPTLDPNGLLTTDLADLANTALQSQADGLSYLQAILTSADRFLSALEVGDISSALLQADAIDAFRLHASDSFFISSQMTHEFRKALLQDDVDNISVAPADVGELFDVLLSNGFPQDELDLFASLGLSLADIDALFATLSTVELPPSSGFDMYSLLERDRTFYRDIASQLRAAPEPTTAVLFVVGLILLALRVNQSSLTYPHCKPY